MGKGKERTVFSTNGAGKLNPYLTSNAKVNLKWGFPGGTGGESLPASAGAQVQSLAREDSVCHGAAKHGHPNY